MEYVVDQVKTTSNVWLGMTFECAQCHDHMYDPFSQHEYYQMFAFFNNNADPGMQTRRGNQAPVVEIMTPERKKQLADSEKVLQEARGKLNARRQQSLDPFKNWFAPMFQRHQNQPGHSRTRRFAGFFPFDQVDLEKTTNPTMAYPKQPHRF